MKVNIFDYTDYRTYLRDKFSELKQTTKYFSHTYFSKMAGFGSTGYLTMVMQNQRNISPKAINRINKALKRGKKEATFFEALVLFNQATTDAERESYLERLVSIKPRIKLTQLDQLKYEYLTKSLFVTIREMMSLPGFNADPAWVSHHLQHHVKPEEVEYAYGVLEKLGLIAKNKEGKWARSPATWATSPDVSGLEVYHYHSQMMKLAKEAMTKIPSRARNISAMTLPVPLSLLPKIKEKLYEVKREIMDSVASSGLPPEEVYQFNFQCFPLTRVSNEVDKK